MSKTCPLCNKLIEPNQFVTAIMVAKFVSQDEQYQLEVTRQAILSHLNCPLAQ